MRKVQPIARTINWMKKTLPFFPVRFVKVYLPDYPPSDRIVPWKRCIALVDFYGNWFSFKVLPKIPPGVDVK